MPISFRDLPAVHRIQADPRLAHLPPERVAATAREVLQSVRSAIQQGAVDVLPDVVGMVDERLRALSGAALRPVFNATGVVLHTNLGRAVWSDAARAAADAASGYCDLEMSLETGERGGRTQAIRERICALTGAEDMVVVNNCAAALLLALTALARDRDVLVSRGELVEIGGSFRVPDIIEAGGARLRPVGTTNRTRLSDFRDAAGTGSAVLLTVHPSNFRIEGFTGTPDRASRQQLARELGLLHVEDAGSGALDEDGGEPGVRDAVAAGVDLVLFSGDKLLGGPQAGFAVGRASVVQRLRKHPMYRTMRLDKTRIAAVEATLAEHLMGRPNPVQAMLSTPPEALQERAHTLARALAARGVGTDVVAVSSATGGGARPQDPLPSWAVRLDAPHPDDLVQRLRTATPAVLARIMDDAVVLDVRTLPQDSDDEVATAVARVVVRS